MIRVVVMGHEGYAEGVKKNLNMIIGEPQNMYFIDLTKKDDLSSFETKVNTLLEKFNDDEVLFVCDLLGASPFRVAATICISHPGKYYTIAGLNPMALLELGTDSDLPMEELVNRSIETAKAAISKFPE